MALQDLIDAAPPGSTVSVPAGVYNEQITIDKPLTLQPEPGATVTIDATGLDSSLPTVLILSSDVTIRDLTIQNGPFHGIQAGNASATNLTNISIINNEIRGHANAGIITNHNASMTISDNIIENNGTGAGFNLSGIVLYPHGPTSILNNSINNNNIDGIFARGSDAGLAIVGNIIENHLNSGITLAWDQKNTSIEFNIINNCGSGNYDEQGGIVIIQSMAETIGNNVIDSCNPSGIFWGWMPTAGDPPDEILISYNNITNSIRDGIYLFSQGPGGFIPPDQFPLEPVIKNNFLLYNGRAGVYVSNLYYYSPGNANPTINNNNIIDNEWGVFNATALTVNAIDNWWGSNTGPYHPTLNPQGTGNPVSDNVDFIPWSSNLQVFEVTGCSVQDVSLENYYISPFTNGDSKVKLVMKVTGYLEIKLTDEISAFLPFDIWFTKNFIMQIPELNNIKPVITATSACNASLIGEVIYIEMALRVVVDIEGKRTILISAIGPCSPRTNLTDFNIQKRKSREIKEDKCQEIYIEECINAQVIFATCQFKQPLLKTIDISDLL